MANLFKTLMGEDSDAKLVATKDALLSAQELARSLAAPDHPQWLKSTIPFSIKI
jgi:hypothetical protein